MSPAARPVWLWITGGGGVFARTAVTADADEIDSAAAPASAVARTVPAHR